MSLFQSPCHYSLVQGPKHRGVAKAVLTFGKPVIVVAVAIITMAVFAVVMYTLLILIPNIRVHNVFNDKV
jgi:hypothetical protein